MLSGGPGVRLPMGVVVLFGEQRGKKSHHVDFRIKMHLELLWGHAEIKVPHLQRDDSETTPEI